MIASTYVWINLLLVLLVLIRYLFRSNIIDLLYQMQIQRHSQQKSVINRRICGGLNSWLLELTFNCPAYLLIVSIPTSRFVLPHIFGIAFRPFRCILHSFPLAVVPSNSRGTRRSTGETLKPAHRFKNRFIFSFPS